jgi:hypothetical protein
MFTNIVYFATAADPAAHPPRQAAWVRGSVTSTLHASVHWGDPFSKTIDPSGMKWAVLASSPSDTVNAPHPMVQAEYAIGLIMSGRHPAMQKGCDMSQQEE